MWPWEHVIVGYLVYSLLSRVVFDTSPGPWGTITVCTASVLPDLVDKPLFWSLRVVDTGYAAGHSLLVGVPLALGIGLLARQRDRLPVGLAFATGFLLHAPGDVVHGYALGGTVHWERLGWPLGSQAKPASSSGLLWETVSRFVIYGEQLRAGDISLYMLVQFGLLLLCAGLWLADGAPGLRELLVWLALWR